MATPGGGAVAGDPSGRGRRRAESDGEDGRRRGAPARRPRRAAGRRQTGLGGVQGAVLEVANPRTPRDSAADRRMVEVEGPTRGTRGIWRNGTSGWAGSGISSGGSRRRGDVSRCRRGCRPRGERRVDLGRIGATIAEGGAERRAKIFPRFDGVRRRRRGRRRCSLPVQQLARVAVVVVARAVRAMRSILKRSRASRPLSSVVGLLSLPLLVVVVVVPSRPVSACFARCWMRGAALARSSTRASLGVCFSGSRTVRSRQLERRCAFGLHGSVFKSCSWVPRAYVEARSVARARAASERVP